MPKKAFYLQLLSNGIIYHLRLPQPQLFFQEWCVWANPLKYNATSHYLFSVLHIPLSLSFLHIPLSLSFLHMHFVLFYKVNVAHTWLRKCCKTLLILVNAASGHSFIMTLIERPRDLWKLNLGTSNVESNIFVWLISAPCFQPSADTSLFFSSESLVIYGSKEVVTLLITEYCRSTW